MDSVPFMEFESIKLGQYVVCFLIMIVRENVLQPPGIIRTTEVATDYLFKDMKEVECLKERKICRPITSLVTFHLAKTGWEG